jgi:cytochrome c oxidase subunit 2
MRIIDRTRQPLGVASLAIGLALTSSARAAVQPESGLGLPRDVSQNGHLVDWLINITSVFNLILFAIMCAWMGWACFKHNRHHPAQYDHGSSKHSVTIALAVSAVIFAIVDGNLFVNSINDLDKEYWNFEKVAANPKTIRLEINAHQWAWDARYAGPDGKFNTDDDIVTWNEIKVPVDAPIYVELTSTDVIHSFYLPNFRTKMDAVPGQVNRFWFQAKQTGDYDIGCAQHCGTHHYKMKALLSVVSPEEFNAWQAEASATAKRAFDPEDKLAHWGWDWKEL